MNDRFKFRAWNVCDDELKGGMLYDVQNETDFDYFLESKKLVVEQCTGLKDKNGRLIYEGDIIASRFQGQLFTANIKYFRAGWVAEFHNWKPTLYQMCNEAKIEVVGNIHENPELLENK